MKTVVGLYSSVAEANKVKIALAGEGYANEHITVIDQTGGDYNTGSSYTGHDRDSNLDTSTVGGKIKHFFSGLTGGDDDTTHAPYAQGVNNGGALLAVTVPDDEAEETADMLQQHGAKEIEGNYNTGSSYGNKTGAGFASDSGSDAGYMTGGSMGSGTRGNAAEDVAVLGNRGGMTGSGINMAGEQVIPVVQEDLVVGKREVSRGGVRVYSHVTERPVSEDVTLHDERIVVDRRPVDRAATDADFNTNPGTIELQATGEEAVVGKRSRVVEEVRVGKESSEHTEQINDTVRRTEVDVENTGTESFAGTGKTTKDRF